MSGIKEIEIKLIRSENRGILHDSRADSRKIIEVTNILIDKINEIVREVNKITNHEQE